MHRKPPTTTHLHGRGCSMCLPASTLICAGLPRTIRIQGNVGFFFLFFLKNFIILVLVVVVILLLLLSLQLKPGLSQGDVMQSPTYWKALSFGKGNIKAFTMPYGFYGAFSNAHTLNFYNNTFELVFLSSSSSSSPILL